MPHIVTLYRTLGKSLYNKFGSLGAALQYAYPEVDWDLSMFSMSGRKKSVQRWLKVKVRELLANTEIIEDYQHPDLQCGAFHYWCLGDLIIRKF